MSRARYIFTVLKTDTEPETSFLFDRWDDYHAATFSPEVETVACYPLEIHGRTYRERQNSLRDLAINIQYADNGGLSYGELADLQSFFRENGRKLGLLREFETEAIC